MSSERLDNINFLIDEDPPSGHLQRFERKLDKELHKSGVIFQIRYIAIAASIIILISSGILLLYQTQYKYSSTLLLANYSPDLAETEKYYNNVLHNKMKAISTINRIDAELTSEIREFHESLKNISSDMKINPGDGRLEDAFFGLYQTQIDVLDIIIEQYN